MNESPGRERAASEALLEKAEAFLQEAVYRSRAAQAERAILSPGGAVPGAVDAGRASAPSEGAAVEGTAVEGTVDESAGPGNCGLGKKAAVVLDLTPRAEELFGQLFPEGLDAHDVEGVRAAMARWIRKQDGLDRKRNHFMKDFRTEHGFDRRAYAPSVASEFERGLERVNEEVRLARRKAAEALLAASRAS